MFFLKKKIEYCNVILNADDNKARYLLMVSRRLVFGIDDVS